MDIQRFADDVTKLYINEVQQNRKDVYCMKFHKNNPSKTFVTTIFIEALGIVDAIMSINELGIGPDDKDCDVTGFVTSNIKTEWMNRRLSEQDLDILRAQMMENNIVEIHI